MHALIWIHIAGGVLALLGGALAVATRKGGAWHRTAGRAFVVAMLVLGATASVLAPFADPVQSPVSGLLVCYFILTGWRAAHRAAPVDGFDRTACAVALGLAALLLWDGVARALAPAVAPAEPPAPGAIIVLGSLCLLAGLGDLRFVLRGALTPRQRIARHLWRMCFSFFIATGSFFLGQMDVLPEMLRHLPTLLVLAFAPLGVMVYALLRHRFVAYPSPLWRGTNRTLPLPLASTPETNTRPG